MYCFRLYVSLHLSKKRRKMNRIIELEGLAPALYPLVGPLIMNPVVLKQNHNFPFRTTEKYRWYVALTEEGVPIGFLPVERRVHSWIINNYYVSGHDAGVLAELLDAVSAGASDAGRPLEAVVLSEDREGFARHGFEVVKEWIRYVRMVKP